MTRIEHVSHALMPLVANSEVPNATKAIIGEIITLDAICSDQPLRGTFEQLGESLEAYGAIVLRAISAVEEFSQNRDRVALREAMLEIKERPVALG
jgi:hypothetical protein